MSTGKYIPKVGEEFEWSYKEAVAWTRAKAICVTDKAIGYEDSKSWIVTVCKSCNFRPIPTKADVERDELVRIIEDSYSSYSGAVHIQKVGFTIPKKIKRSDVASVVDVNSCMKGYEDETLIRAVCDLLGDLVESDV